VNATRIFGKLLFGSHADARAVQAAIDAGHDINAADNADEWTVLHYALTVIGRPPSVDVVKVLIANGARLDQLDRRGWTPLRFAARTGSREAIELLIAAGADPNLTGADGITPLHEYVLRTPIDPDLDVVRFFVDHGAMPTPKLLAFVRACSFAKRAAVLVLLGDREPIRDRVGPLHPEDIRELVALWKRRLSGDEGIRCLRKQGGIEGWYQLLASVPRVALAVATELERDPEHAIEVEQLREYLAAMELPPAARRELLSRLDVQSTMDWDEAVKCSQLSRDYTLRFEAWIARAREIERGPTPTVSDPLGVGAEVSHPSFGRGVVLTKAGDQLTIAFADGNKRVLARFVRPSTDTG
jgi:hypothetical protein